VDRFTTGAGREITVRLNELGMRGPSLAEPLPKDALTVVFLGGSTTENYALAREQTFPELVGRDLEARLGRPVRILNAGMSAATTSTTLARLQHQVLDLAPSLIVVHHGINDLVGGFHTRFRRDGRHLPRPPGLEGRPRSYLFSYIRNLRSPPSNRTPTPRARELSVLDYSASPALAVFSRNLRSMASIATAHELPILFLTQATTYELGLEQDVRDRFFMVESLIALGMTPPDVESLAAGMRAYNAVVLEIDQSPWVSVYDLAAELPRSWDLFTDDCHLTAEGNGVVAELLSPVVAHLVSGRGTLNQVGADPPQGLE